MFLFSKKLINCTTNILNKNLHLVCYDSIVLQKIAFASVEIWGVMGESGGCGGCGGGCGGKKIFFVEKQKASSKMFHEFSLTFVNLIQAVADVVLAQVCGQKLFSIGDSGNGNFVN